MRYDLTTGNDTFTQRFEDRNNWDDIRGLAGNDVIKVYQGFVVGGQGNDRIERIPDPANPGRQLQVAFEGRAGVRVDLLEGWAIDDYGDRDLLIGVMGAHGSGYNDWFRGNELNNFFWGNGGNDTVIGGAGDDGVQLPMFQPSPNQPWRDPELSDLSITVSPDGRLARVTPLFGQGFDLQLEDVEYLWMRVSGIWSRVNLTDFITQSSMAQGAIAAGGSARWNASSPLGTGVNLSFSFVSAAPTSGPGAPGFRPFTEAERQWVRLILAQTSDLTGLVFTEVAESGSTVGDLRFGVSQQLNTKGVSWLPGTAGGLAGDVWMDVESMVGLAPGTEGYQALLHEIGHALGLRHPRNVDTTDNWPVQLRSVDDRTALSVMSQVSAIDGLFQAGWGPLDVLALRYLYGTKPLYTSDSLHRLNSAQLGRQLTIVDDGGIDTLDASGLLTPVSISLRPGSLSSVGQTPDGRAAQDNLAIPQGIIIERLMGTDFDDVLIGNLADNTIQGNRGNDWIDGGEGVDTTVFSGPMSAYRIQGSFGVLFVEALDGVSGFDTLLSIEKLAFSDRTVDADNIRVTGDLRQGEVLSASVSLAQPERVRSAFEYQWRINDNPITGATNATYKPTQQDVNQRLSLVVSYTDDRGQFLSLLYRAPVGVANTNDPATGFVRIEGVPQVGQTLKVVWELQDLDGYGGYQIVWRRNGIDIGAASQDTYVVRLEDLGADITVAIQYRDYGGTNDGMVSPVAVRIARTGQIPNSDTISPTLSISSDRMVLKSGETTKITFTLSEPSFDFTLGDIITTGGTLSDLSGRGAEYTATFTPLPGRTGTATVFVPSGVFSDAAGNFNSDGLDSNNRVTLTVDTVAPTISSQQPMLSGRSVALAAPLVFTFSEAVKPGAGRIRLATAAGQTVEVFEANSSRLKWQGDTLAVDPTADFKWFTSYTVSFDALTVLDSFGNSLPAGIYGQFRTQAMDGAYSFFAVAFGAAPGQTYMEQASDALNSGATLAQVVEAFSTKSQFTNLYPLTLSNREFAQQMVNRVVKDSASAAAKAQAVSDIEFVLNAGWSRGKTIFQVFGNLASKPTSDPDWGRTALQFQKQVAVSKYVTEVIGFSGTDLIPLQAFLAPIGPDTDVSTSAALATLVGLSPPGG